MIAKSFVRKLVIVVCLWGCLSFRLHAVPPTQIAPSGARISFESINQIRREIENVLYDINGDNLLNCIDYAMLFYSYYPYARIIRNNNPYTGMNHLFNSVVLDDGRLIYIEPQGANSTVLMEDVWGWEYNPAYNIDETYLWGQQIISRPEQERRRIAREQQLREWEEAAAMRRRKAREAAWLSSPIKPVYGVGFASFSVYSSIYGLAIVSLFPEIGLDVGKLQLNAFADYTVFWKRSGNDNWPETLNFGTNATFWLTYNWSLGIGYGTGGEFDNWNIKSYSPFIRASLGIAGIPGSKRNYSSIKVFYDYSLHDDNYRAGILFGPGLLQTAWALTLTR